jgi:serine/threonine protein kinase
MASEASDLQAEIPKELNGRFTIEAKIVERPSCIVFRGIDKDLGNRNVAIKVFIDRPLGKSEWIAAFEREISLLRAASHPSLVPIIAGGQASDWLYIVMELIEGKTLRDYLKDRPGPLDCAAAVELTTQICAGLKEIHEKNGFHGHIDSRAVLFKGDEPRLAGYYPHVVSEIQKSVTSSGRLIVDPAYISPDQINGEGSVDGRADIYSVSILLYEMLTGQKPFVADNPMQLAMMRLSKNPEPPRKFNPAVSALVDAAVMKGLARDRNQRFATIGDFVDALTGGKKPVKNPLLGAAGEPSERLGNTETIAVSMSTDSIKHILAAHESKRAEKAAAPKDTNAIATATGMKAADDLSGAATVMGLKVDDALKASFIVMNGDNRGKRYLVERPQIMIGSDSGCDICLSGKGVPPRYAIVVQRNGEFFVGPLSSTPVSVNDNTTSGSDEIQLKRGDVVHCGPHQLRYVAPGEVFTLRDAVADRVVDRPPNKLPRVLAVLAIVVTLVCAGVFVMYRQSVEAHQAQARRMADSKRRQQKDLIEHLRMEGDEFFKKGALMDPPDANARKRFEQILEIDSEDMYARRRLSEIDERILALTEQEAKRRQFADRIAKLTEDGKRLFAAGKYITPAGASARDAFQEVLRLDPENENAKKQLAEINRVLNDLVGQINGLLAKAHEYMEAQQYVTPPGENAKETIDRISAIDPNNKDAHDLMIEMAARLLMDGNRFRAELKPDEMKQAYTTAQAIGVDPEYVSKKLQGIDTIKRSKGSIVIIDTSQTKDAKENSRYLSMAEIEQKMNLLQVQGYGSSKDKKQQLYEIKH